MNTVLNIWGSGVSRLFLINGDLSITTALDNTALKIGSKCSFTLVNCAFSPIFALSCLRSLRYAEVSNGYMM